MFRGVHRPPSRSQREVPFAIMSLRANQRYRSGPEYCWHRERDAFLQLCIFFRLASSLKLTLRLLASLAKQREAQVFGDTRLSASETWLVSEMLCHEKVCLARLGMCIPPWILSRLFCRPFALLPTFLLIQNPGLHNSAAWVRAWTSNANACGWLVPTRDATPRSMYGPGVRPMA